MDAIILRFKEMFSPMTDNYRDNLPTISQKAQDCLSYIAQPRVDDKDTYQNTNVDYTFIPEDTVDLGTSENSICEEILNEKLQQCIPSITGTKYIQYYGTPYGSVSLRRSIASFMTKFLKTAAPIDPEKMIVSLGCGTLLSILSMALVDDGDYLMVSRPLYHAVRIDVYSMSRVKMYPVEMNEKTLAKGFGEGYEKAMSEGKNIRCVIVLNPDNPSGRVYSKEEILDMLQFCKRHNLHVIMDEIYALSIFGDTKFESVLSIANLPDPNKTHFIWGLSKDFGMSGYRVGVLHTLNEALLKYIKSISEVFHVPTIIQALVESFISDHDFFRRIVWMESVYFPTYIKRLQSSYKFIKERLLELDVPIHPQCEAGLYVWADFSKHMKSKTFEEEGVLAVRMRNKGVLLIRGKLFLATEPGWFRIVFAHSIPVLEKGLKKIKEVLEDTKIQDEQ